MKVASHSVGAGFPPNGATSCTQPFRAPVCHALRTSVQSAPTTKTDPLRGASDAGICDPDMESPTRQNNGEKFRTEPSIHSAPRVFQRPASSRQQPRLTRTGDGLHNGRRAQRTAGNPAVRFDPQQPRLTETGGAHKALQTFHWPNGTAACDNGKREISAGAVREDETGCEQDDRSSDPRFRSAPTDRKHRSNARSFLQPASPMLAPRLYSPIVRRWRGGRRNTGAGAYTRLCFA